MKIAIGNDHAGVEYKNYIQNFLTQLEHQVKNFGTDASSSVDYPDFAHPVANEVENNNADFGILICGSGNGVAMAANKHQNIRAALCWNVELAKLARQHNNANVLCIPARFVSQDLAKEMVIAFLEETFEGGRHEQRVEKIACL